MPTARVNMHGDIDIEVFYVEDGAPDGAPLLLIMGLTSQLIAWPQPLVDDLANRGYRVIRLDNRDCGLSTHLDGVPDCNTFPWTAPYHLTDMATDTVGLLDHLEIDQVHVVGASMGGMIAQRIILDHPDRVRSLCSIMSTTGRLGVGLPTLEAAAAVTAPVPTEREAAIEHIVRVLAIIGSQSCPLEPDEAHRQVAEAYDRAFYPEGGKRQSCAIMRAVDRTEGLRGVTVSTLVLHGLEDSLINPSGGQATAQAVPGAKLIELDGMGHDLPAHLWSRIADEIDHNARQAKG